MSSHEVSDAIRKGLEIYKERGGAKGDWIVKGKVCALQALHESISDLNSGCWYSAANHLWATVRELTGEDCITTAMYNDREDITKEDVIVLFEKALAKAEEKGI